MRDKSFSQCSPSSAPLREISFVLLGGLRGFVVQNPPAFVAWCWKNRGTRPKAERSEAYAIPEILFTFAWCEK
jgi:hypothetical protein